MTPAPEIEDPDGHALGGPVRGVLRALYGWTTCSCPEAQAANMGHSTVSCQRPGCGWVHHDPPHRGEEWIRRPTVTVP